MALDAGIISSIIDGATSITGSFLQIGSAVNAANHMQAPEGDTAKATGKLADNINNSSNTYDFGHCHYCHFKIHVV